MWKVYVAYGEGHDKHAPVRIVGPLPINDLTTGCIVNTFKLVQLVKRIKYWAERTFWPWFVEAIMVPLAQRGA